MSKKTKKPESKQKKNQHRASPTGKLVEIDAKLPITDAMCRERGKQAYMKLHERDNLILERKSVAADYKARIDALTSELTKLLMEFNDGIEVRTVRAREVRNFKDRTVDYIYQGKVIHSRAMTLADRQDDLPFKDKNAPIPKVDGVTSETKPAKDAHAGAKVIRIADSATKHDPVAAAHQKDADAKRADIASVIQSETSAKSKWSAVDGENPHA